jgi:predicted nucleic acid-binding protein
VILLIDTNVVLDLLLDRPPFADDAAILFERIESGAISAFLCGTTITTIFYIAAKTVGDRPAKKAIGKLLSLCEIAPVGRTVLEEALAMDCRDFEDAVIAAAARCSGAEAVISRNS